ncbi:MAG: methylmalonyl-CoA epimerase [Bacteroidota bacterium]
MLNIDHIGIAVKNLSDSETLFSKLLNIKPYKRETVESESVITSFFQKGETKIELLESLSANSSISKFIEKKGEGIHHIAFEVENIEQEMKRLVQEGFTLVNEQSKVGADNKLVCFLHPKTTNGVLIELVQSIKIK